MSFQEIAKYAATFGSGLATGMIKTDSSSEAYDLLCRLDNKTIHWNLMDTLCTPEYSPMLFTIHANLYDKDWTKNLFPFWKQLCAIKLTQEHTADCLLKFHSSLAREALRREVCMFTASRIIAFSKADVEMLYNSYPEVREAIDAAYEAGAYGSLCAKEPLIKS